METGQAKADRADNVKRASTQRRVIARTCVIPLVSRMELLGQILDELKQGCEDKDILFWVRLAIDEAIINAITHGHGEDINSPRAPVRVDYVIDEHSIAVRVTDNGLGFDPSAVPDPTLDENLYRVTGRGIFLMRKAMDRVVYNAVGNSVLMIRRVKTVC